ncbi:MAG: hypothetical protein GX628_07350 [Clostridiales bacterium]|nr:hypothetical protein [Clostridiales bacterium]
MGYLRKKLSSNRLSERIIWAAVMFFAMFFGIMLASYFLLPEGLLKNKNPLQSWNTSDSALILALQIFLYNLLSVLIIILASLFARKKSSEADYLSVGYMAYYTLISINSIVLGTWSFSVETEAVPLIDRVAGTFDIIHRAGLWEMTGQLLITCAIAHISVVRSSGSDTIKRNIREIRLANSEKAALLIGIGFMLIGAFVESISINNMGH